MTASLTFEAVEVPAAFTVLRDAWREILEACPGHTIFLTPEWMESWWDAYRDSRAGVVIVARRGTRIVALVPLQVTREPWRMGVAARTLRFLTDGSYDADYLDFIATPDAGEDLAPALWRWLRRNAPIRFDLARWNEIPETSPWLVPLRGTLEGDGALIEEETIGAVEALLPDSWDAYLGSLKPRMRTKVRSLERDLEAAHRVRLLACERSEDAAVRLPSLFDLHERRWALRGGQGVFRGPRKRAFYERLTARLLERGWLQFHSLEADGALVAHQFCMGYRGTVYLLQEGYDPNWEDRGVGNALRALVLRRLIAEGWRRYDFLAGVTEHKRSWGGRVKEGRRLFARGPTLLGAGAGFLERAALRIRSRRNAS